MQDQTILITGPTPIPFTDMTRKYGRAEFDLCFRKRRNWFLGCHIIPKQQPDAISDFYVLKKFKRWNIMGFDGLEEPWVWSGNTCPAHNGFNLSVYVPPGSSILRVEFGSDEIRFMFFRRDFK